MRLSAVDVDKHEKDDWEFDFCLLEDIGNKLGKFGIFVEARLRSSPGGRGTAHSVMDSVYYTVDDIF